MARLFRRIFNEGIIRRSSEGIIRRSFDGFDRVAELKSRLGRRRPAGDPG